MRVVEKSAALLLCVVCIIGCLYFIFGCSDGGDTEQSNSPSATPTPTSTPTPTPRPSTTPEMARGYLYVWTTPVAGEIYVDGDFSGVGKWEGALKPGLHLVSFGPVDDYVEPLPIKVMIIQDQHQRVQGNYVEPCYFTNIIVNGQPWRGQTIVDLSTVDAHVEFTMVNGEYWKAYSINGSPPNPSTGLPGENSIDFSSNICIQGCEGYFVIDGYVEGNRRNCDIRIPFFAGGL